MKQTRNSLLIGAKVLINWPSAWQTAQPQYHEQLKLEAAKNDARFGETGVIVDYSPSEDFGRRYGVLLDKSREIERFREGAMTVLELPKNDDAEVVDLLKQIARTVDNIEGMIAQRD